jgi:hypothetical protein
MAKLETQIIKVDELRNFIDSYLFLGRFYQNQKGLAVVF